MNLDPKSKTDVVDTARLARYLAKREAWLILLSEDHHHSVNGQLSGLLWQDTAFQLFNEMRRGAPGTRPATITSGLLAEALDSGYVTNMIVGIGRLIDKDRDVVSLRRVFDDVYRHRELITREIYVCHDGLPYDPKSVPPPWERGSPGELIGTIAGGPLDASSSELLHTAFDRLSGVPPDSRTRNDQIADAIFKEIETLLSDAAIQDILDRRNKFVAHAADAKSRAKRPLANYTVSMADVESALRPIVKALDKLQGDILSAGGRGLMEVAQFNVLEGLSGTLTDDQLLELHDIWDRLSDARNKWHE
jgi:chorismate mutase